ncbi:PREDICTED: polynucleotide 3'-phosphatase ZDP isoform X2 [Tarenaya hassleriana]|uniref:polynucleotide 3'-phosphatase ZDP isoform X2 n=1 Tax=Tarenaya hassleriana TaxID=28532 RepID=UPI00053C4899|nr:PREDICTED: polynucleotide 3'-phosphatase ZDP isoform X2 [Tarenaya hassleriana]
MVTIHIVRPSPRFHLLSLLCSNLHYPKRNLYLCPCSFGRTTNKSSLETMPITAEYAKSNRSTCKSCSKTITMKTLRLGLITKGPGGIDMTRWHHLDCFPTDSESVASAEDVQGFSSLEKDDQDAVTKLIEQCGEPAKEKQVDEKGVENEQTAPDDKSKQKIKEKVGSPSPSAKIIAEYAKSNRSSCKKCSQTIAAKTLRLGLVTRDFRGFETTKWHHLDCFPIDSDPINSAESISGFSSLQNDEQDALKRLVERCGKKPVGVHKTDEDNDDLGADKKFSDEAIKRKHAQIEETEGTKVDQQSTRKPKAEIEAKISLSVSDIKDKYRDANLLPKWKAFQTVIFLEKDDGLHDSDKIAAFDFDGCLAKTSVKIVGADAWSLMYPSIPKKLQSLYSQGYKLVIFTNESNIDRWKNKRQAAVDSKIGRLNNFINRVEVPIQVFIACGVAISDGKEDVYRKPKTGMWQLLKNHFNSGIEIDMEKSFYVGDAAGRKDDHSDADIKFAHAIGLKFYTPEDYFAS